MEEPKPEDENATENISHSEMRAILWGRQISRSQSEPQRVSECSEEKSLDNKMKRPTSLSDEWRELQKLRLNSASETLLPQTQNVQSRQSIWKNFIALCSGLMLAFMSFLPLRNIQSSIYPVDNLGTICLSSMYAAFIVGCTVSPWLVQNARPKGLVLFAVASHVFYMAANLYPSYGTLIPASLVFGFLQAPLWSVQELLIGSYGSSYSAITGIRVDKSIRQFQSVFVIFCHCAQIMGNLIESLVLNLGKYENRKQENRTYTTPVFNCSNNCKTKNIKFGYEIQRPSEIFEPTDYLEILKLIYFALTCFAMILIGICLRKPDIILNKRKMSLCEKLGDVLCFFKTKNCALIGLLMVFTGMQQAVVISDVTMVYGTEKLGLPSVGYMMMCYGTCQLATLLVLERMSKRFRPIVFILKGFLITLGLLILLYVWEPRDNSVLTIFGFMALWGATDAIWQSQIQNILIMSTTKRESAVVCFRICQGFGLTIVFLSSLWLSLLYKVCMVGATLVFGVMGYMLLEVTNNPVTPMDPEPFPL